MSMNGLVIKQVASFPQIYSAMKECASDFFEKSLNNESDILRMAQKFEQFGVVLTATVEGEIAGLIACYCNDISTKCGYISIIVTKHAYQGKGVGTALLKRIADYCRQKDYTRIRLEVANENVLARKFYCGMGFSFETSATQKSDYYVLNL